MSYPLVPRRGTKACLEAALDRHPALLGCGQAFAANAGCTISHQPAALHCAAAASISFRPPSGRQTLQVAHPTRDEGRRQQADQGPVFHLDRQLEGQGLLPGAHNGAVVGKGCVRCMGQPGVAEQPGGVGVVGVGLGGCC